MTFGNSMVVSGSGSVEAIPLITLECMELSEFLLLPTFPEVDRMQQAGLMPTEYCGSLEDRAMMHLVHMGN